MDGKTLSSRLRELVKFLATVKGDLANVTGPPSLLAPSSVVEVGHCWAQRPSVFSAPAREPCPERRSLLVLRWFLIALRSQLYVGVPDPSTTSSAAKTAISIRKPLNAFLGELFLASWTDEVHKSKTELVAEQVSHHPPITAMHVVDREHGVRADGYARVEMTFNGNVNIRQVGHATLRVDRYEEDHLIPLPDVKVRGFMSGCMYPEIDGEYFIVSSSGFVTELRFWGEGIIRGKRNSFEGRIYRRDDPKKKSIYQVEGVWSGGWTVKDSRTGEVLESYRVDAPENEPLPVEIPPLEEQDPWESRNAWQGVLHGLMVGDMRMVVNEKTKIEQAQRQMRASEVARGKKWQPLLFRSGEGEAHEVFHKLSEGLGWQLQHERTKGVWRVDDGRVKNLQRPFRPGVTPLGY
ncbi:Protein kes1 [Madurella mycetomatis]|uniref:Protein kes1 n=1 Tax=Madurella mycetomatis TaxID=100816 RepID=A0A175WFZ6_9PEZI|nr:Protein kes1 [Madurella mycetomatis]KXX82441.1 Protein kes1 [Madurella mycetomatis]